jgi:hypothetical protein
MTHDALCALSREHLGELPPNSRQWDAMRFRTLPAATGGARPGATPRARPQRNVATDHNGFSFHVKLSHKSPAANVRLQLSGSKAFWESSETNQSPGNGSVWAAADICDSLTWIQHSGPSASWEVMRAPIAPLAC